MSWRHKWLSQERILAIGDQALPRKVSNQVLTQLSQAWEAFFEAMAQWREHPDKFLGRPKLPKYKHKTEGRNLSSMSGKPSTSAR